MDFKIFCKMNLQIASLMFGRDPINLGHQPPIHRFNKFIEFIKKGYEEKKKPLDLFDNPDKACI